jgi:hypothetical protein
MFVQIIQAKATDPGGIRKEMDRWMEELAPGAEGWLGVTAGVAADGDYWSVVRFESEDAARRNSDRPEQGEWWNAMSAHFEGDAKFYESSEVDTILGGGSDEAGFVQIMKGRAKDPDKLAAMMREGEPEMSDRRPDVIGGLVARFGTNEFITTMYFTSEAEAREGEKNMGPEDGPAMDGLIEEMQFIDISEPVLRSR